MCLEKQAQDNSNLYVAVTWLEAGSRYFLWQTIAVCRHIFSTQLNKRRNLIQMRYKWVWCNGANWEFSVLRWGPTCSQPVFQRASLCQTRQSRVHSLPETRAVWLSSCYWLLFLWRAGFCQVNFFSSASCQNTDCTELHTQALKAQPTLSTPNSHLSSDGKHAIFDKQLKVWMFPFLHRLC